MEKASQIVSVTALIVLAGLTLVGCGGPGEARYVNRANSAEVLTMNRSKTVKTKVIATFHGTSTGSYTLKTATGTTSGTFRSDGEGIKFWPADGEAEAVKFKSDGSFDYAHATWTPAYKKELKAVLSSSTQAGSQ